jgi:hypothetical protein
MFLIIWSEEAFDQMQQILPITPTAGPTLRPRYGS